MYRYNCVTSISLVAEYVCYKKQIYLKDFIIKLIKSRSYVYFNFNFVLYLYFGNYKFLFFTIGGIQNIFFEMLFNLKSLK